jgi:hypothetical protein
MEKNMKKFMILVSVVLSLAACSSSSNDGNGAKPAGNVTPEITAFANKSGGQWVSECMQDEKGINKEIITINKDGTGSYTTNYYRDQACAGDVANTEGPTAFTYTAEALNGGSTKIKMTLNRQVIDLSIINQGDRMTITANGRTVQYTRIGQAPNEDQNQVNPVNPNPGNNPPAIGLDFDTMAKGNWISQNCTAIQGGSYKQVLQIKGQGKAASIFNVFKTNDCSGNEVQGVQPQEFTYAVVRFANGAGEITITGETTSTNAVRFQGRQMTLSTQQGDVVFIKIN